MERGPSRSVKNITHGDPIPTHASGIEGLESITERRARPVIPPATGGVRDEVAGEESQSRRPTCRLMR